MRRIVGDCESEIEMADRAVALNVNSCTGWANRGWVYRVAGLPEEAVRSFERAIRLRCREESATSEPLLSVSLPLSRIRFRPSGRDAEAREVAVRLLEVDPAFTISTWIARGGQSNMKLTIEGLQKAGLPE
jgi:adenylate cyclase